jgi:hypothetical protein
MNMKIKRPNPLKKKAQKGFKGYPVATVAYYGPDNKLASKVAVGIIVQEDADPIDLQRWHSEQGDVRFDKSINMEIMEYIQQHEVKTVALSDGIMGCPHEEGTDYPDGEKCPQCPFWANRDRFTGEMIH